MKSMIITIWDYQQHAANELFTVISTCINCGWKFVLMTSELEWGMQLFFIMVRIRKQRVCNSKKATRTHNVAKRVF